MLSKRFFLVQRLTRPLLLVSCFMRSLIRARAESGSVLVIAKPKASLNTGKGETPAITSAGFPRKGKRSQAPLHKRVWALAFPAIGEQVFALVVGLSDTFLTGHLSTQAIAQLGYGRADAVAAVGVGATIVWVVLTLFFAVGVGVTALVAHAVGAHDHALSRKGSAQGIVLVLLAGILLAVLALPIVQAVTDGLGVEGRLRGLRQHFCVSSRLGCLGSASPLWPTRPCAEQGILADHSSSCCWSMGPIAQPPGS